MKSLVVLDVDNTLVFGNEELNVALLEALQTAGIQEVILLTNMNADEVVQALTSQASNPYLPRSKLIKIMKETYGINVLDVIVPADYTLVNMESSDSVKPHKVGAVYTEIHDWVEGEYKRTFDGLMNGSNSDEFFFSEIDETKSRLYILKEKFKEFRKRINDYTNQSSIMEYALRHGKTVAEVEEELSTNCIAYSELLNPKGQMLKAYLKQHPELDSSNIIYFDDNEECLQSVKAEYPDAQVIQVNGKKNEPSDYGSIFGTASNAVTRYNTGRLDLFMEQFATYVLPHTINIVFASFFITIGVLSALYIPTSLFLGGLGVVVLIGVAGYAVHYGITQCSVPNSVEDVPVIESVIESDLGSVIENALESTFEPLKETEHKTGEKSSAGTSNTPPVIEDMQPIRSRSSSVLNVPYEKPRLGLVRRHSTGELNRFFPVVAPIEEISIDAKPKLAF